MPRCLISPFRGAQMGNKTANRKKVNKTGTPAQMSSEEKRRLKELGVTILRETGLEYDYWKDYDAFRRDNYAGYAEYYLRECYGPDRMKEADVSVYRRLVDIDTVLGTDASQQLNYCIYWTTRRDIITVCNFY